MKKIKKLNNKRVTFICLFAFAALLSAYEYARLRMSEIHTQKATQTHIAPKNGITKDVNDAK